MVNHSCFEHQLPLEMKKLEPTAWDEKKSEDVTPAGFGRIAAQTAKQVILQKFVNQKRTYHC